MNERIHRPSRDEEIGNDVRYKDVVSGCDICCPPPPPIPPPPPPDPPWVPPPAGGLGNGGGVKVCGTLKEDVVDVVLALVLLVADLEDVRSALDEECDEDDDMLAVAVQQNKAMLDGAA
ncbi:hypothetical protein MSAN_01211800 [Mycena sanguinolenta]|uniref:Uncharacterized protein n=1 Tax=Mycena sanguinolenta TaxID=230812 RepID=A0A8H6YCT8_9AGAR|nr:hypothetical protein MSAN_01211800 [Mycena sanguinolenta]